MAVVRPPSWEPTDRHRELAQQQGVDLIREHAKFRDHHDARRSRFVDWDAALRTWLRNAGEYAARAGPKRPTTGDNPYLRILERMPT